LEEAEIGDAAAVSYVTGLENVTRVDRVNDFDNVSGIKKLFPEEKNGYDKVKSVL
jgi:Asp-tRNA(Asn)/Glu-tRNA(Gln) amidotransferase C subunit